MKEALNKSIIFSNGTIYIDSERKVKNILVTDGKVAAFDIALEKFNNTELVDLKGSTVYPGFIDSHVHLIEVGSCAEGIPVRGCTTADEIAQAIAEKSQHLPEGSLIIGNAFSLPDYDAWSLEDLAKLDKATGAHPAIVFDDLGHNMIINSISIEKCGITAQTKAPMGGKIIVQDGKPTGMLRESAMTLAGNKLFPLISEKTVHTGAKACFDLWASMGYTSIVDLMGAPFGRMLRLDICKQMEKEGILPLRINYMYTFFSLDEIDNALKYKNQDTDLIRFGGLKLFVDGAYAGGQAWTTWENKQGNHGLYYVHPDDTYGKEYNINRIVEKVNELGLNIHYHMQGDEAVEVVLSALEKAREKKGKITSTHTFIHLAYPTDEQIARMKSFNGHVVAAVQPAFWQAEGDLSRYYGDHEKSCYPIKKLIAAGILAGMSTDYWVSPLELSSPTAIMSVALAGAGDPVNHPPLTVQEVIHGLTVGSAATTPRKDLGKLDVGYMADMVVYDKDFYSVDSQAFNKDYPKVLATWVGGKKVYETKA